jgi:hypothetical protein
MWRQNCTLAHPDRLPRTSQAPPAAPPAAAAPALPLPPTPLTRSPTALLACHSHPLNYLHLVRNHRNCAWPPMWENCDVPWKGMGRRQPRMRYSGAVIRLAQSPLTAPFSFWAGGGDGRRACHPKPYTFFRFFLTIQSKPSGVELRVLGGVGWSEGAHASENWGM